MEVTYEIYKMYQEFLEVKVRKSKRIFGIGCSTRKISRC